MPAERARRSPRENGDGYGHVHGNGNEPHLVHLLVLLLVLVLLLGAYDRASSAGAIVAPYDRHPPLPLPSPSP